MRHDTAGDPMTALKWTRRTTAKLAAELGSLGIEVSARTVARLLTQMHFSLCANQKKLSGHSPKERDAQFGRIAKLRDRCASHRLPIISVDTKKKEMVGLFKNPGRAWTPKPLLVNDHDFRSQAEGMAVPYGILDMRANRGTLFVGTSHDTPHFAVDAIEKWWRTEGRDRYPDAQHLAVLADAGGSNGPTCRAWKHGLQTRICNRHGLTVTVAHYPTGASKWNPIEHRLFSEISKNWAGRPLDSFQTILNYIRTTRTTTGLRVRAHLVRRYYKKETRISDAEMRDLRVAPTNQALPKWNYTLRPA
jgi:hypothetical protein